ncbi:lipopolysaccharide biosynthesis protein [Sunxiuqinia elliptica]|uniref:Na+-driven multidrug efflux pump n=1 Tax=Sunxiuqinia elliptica TaxID=655355 RepID=A0A4R6H4B0_9BACT|nr:MATE family efflux transporter [Sunxiuqinia elliptica]TDO02677.1 Na+-driven multidrug efflux pump [Sunxiuqinia elliptica]TDO58585.1 Na+-driven multidrug efflux pump [Sunxiuqinia elliptica]
MQPAKRVAVNTGILYARMAITVFISLYATRLVLAALGAEDYGIFNVVGGAVAMLTFLSSAMSSATQRFMSYAQGEGNKQKQKSIFSVSVILHLLIAIVVVVFIEIVGYFLFDSILEIPDDRMDVAKILFQFMVVRVFFAIISVPYDAVINAHENMLLVAVLGIIEAIMKLSIAVYLAYVKFDQLLVFGGLMVTLSVVLIFLRGIYCSKKYDEVQYGLVKNFDKQLFKEMTGYASWSLLSSTSSLVTMRGVSIVLNSFFGVIVNAAQAIADQITGQLMVFSNMMLKALNPVIVKSEGENNRRQMLKASMTGNKISFFLIAFFAIPVIIEMPFILDTWLKDVPEYTVIFCRLSVIKAMIDQLTVTFGTAVGATGNIRKMSFWYSFVYIFLLPVSYVAFKFGAAPHVIYVNIIIMSIALAAIRIYFTYWQCGLDVKQFLYDVVVRCVIITILVVLIACTPFMFIENEIIRFMMVVFSSSLFFIVFMLLIGLKQDEKRMLHGILKTILDRVRERIKSKYSG